MSDNHFGLQSGASPIDGPLQAERQTLWAPQNRDAGLRHFTFDTLGELLQKLADSVVHHLGAAVARIWMLNAEENVLELSGSAGKVEQDDNAWRKLPVGHTLIGQIAQARRPYVTNDLPNDSRLADQQWPSPSAFSAFAGYPVVADDQVIGVIAVWSTHPFNQAASGIMAVLADQIALAIQRKQTEVRLDHVITEHKQLEEQVRQAQKMEAIGKLAGGVAHDFNNLLTIINGYSEVILSSLRSADPLRGPAQHIIDAGERAARLTRQLLAFSRKQVLVLDILDLNSHLSDLQKMLGRLIGEDIDLAVRLEPKLWKVKADSGQVEQVIMNLVVNARDAMPEGGMLTIETANIEIDAEYAAVHREVQPGKYVQLAISDTGCGMDPATRARIFEPFFTTKGPDKGTGLGLSTVYGVVKQSGGHIEVYSEPRLGTSFKVYFPRARQETRSSRLFTAPKPPARGTETVLLVEDEADVRSLVRLILEGKGYKVLEASQGGEALLLCEQTKDIIPLLITDVVMPNMGGRKLAERLKALRPDMRVLYLSGYTDDAIVRHGILGAEMPFLQKPFNANALACKVREILDQKEIAEQ